MTDATGSDNRDDFPAGYLRVSPKWVYAVRVPIALLPWVFLFAEANAWLEKAAPLVFISVAFVGLAFCFLAIREPMKVGADASTSRRLYAWSTGLPPGPRASRPAWALFLFFLLGVGLLLATKI